MDTSSISLADCILEWLKTQPYGAHYTNEADKFGSPRWQYIHCNCPPLTESYNLEVRRFFFVISNADQPPQVQLPNYKSITPDKPFDNFDTVILFASDPELFTKLDYYIRKNHAA